MRVRTARNTDWPFCLELDMSYETESAWQIEMVSGDKVWEAHFEEIRLPRKQRMSPSLPKEIRLKGWERRDGFWVAAEHRKILGYLTLSHEVEQHTARICDLVVALEERRQGIASELFQTAVTWCSRQDVAQLMLACPPKAQPAISFALKHGFVFCGFQEAYWPGQELALFLCKRIR
ncbi:MAG: GNAT family N-acetyltransferase [Anaerolineae bacterium]|nr:GNAT family N-acetyltransferase [Anaerolineae bacterium]